MEHERQQSSLQDVEVGLDVLLAVLKRKGIPLPFEIGAFIALEACEQMLDAPVQVRDCDLVIGEVGEISVLPSAARASEPAAVQAMLVLLGDLLVCSAPGVPEMLLELVEHGPSVAAPERLRDELEACLLPLNRGATRRVLARLLREARKAGERTNARSQHPLDSVALDAELDALLGGSPPQTAAATPAAVAIPSLRDQVSRAPTPVPAPPAPTAVAGRARVLPAAELDALLDDDGAGSNAASPRPAPPPAAAQAATGAAAAGSHALEPHDSPSSQHASLEPPPTAAASDGSGADAEASGGHVQARGPALFTEQLLEATPAPRGLSGASVLGGLLLLVSLVLVAAYVLFGQQGARTLLGLRPLADTAGAARADPAGVVKPGQPVGELRVNSQPTRAQVFLLVGNGPALATDLPVGVAHEFVALAEGHAPARAIVPSDVSWEMVDGRARYELAIQTGKPATKVDQLELGATLLPSDVGTPTGALGSVRVVTTPKGAKVYQLIGFTPDVRVENLPLDRDYDVLIYRLGHAMIERHLSAADFRGSESHRVAELEVQLAARPRG